MRLVTMLCLIVSGLTLAAVAGASAPKVTATVKTLSPTSRQVHIVNHDRVTYRDFVVQSVNAPKILEARILKATKPCGPVQRDGNFNGTKFNWRYRAECKRALAPGKAFNIGLTTSGNGKLTVFVIVNGEFVRISK